VASEGPRGPEGSAEPGEPKVPGAPEETPAAPEGQSPPEEPRALAELLGEADERGLAASGLACLERCLPLLGEERGSEVLRPLWAGLTDGADDWATGLTKVRESLDPPAADDSADAESGATGEPVTGLAWKAALVRGMLAAAPAEWDAEALRAWADDCSLTALRLHHRLGGDSGNAGDGGNSGGEQAGGDGDAAVDAVGELLRRCREGDTEGAGPLVAGEVRRQTRVLEILAEGEGGMGLRQVLAVATEGQRVLRAVVSRRARVRG
jgi:hypothetical protein